MGRNDWTAGFALNGSIPSRSLRKPKNGNRLRGFCAPARLTQGRFRVGTVVAKAQAVFCSLSPSSLTVSSRIKNFCTLPVTVIGNASTNLM